MNQKQKRKIEQNYMKNMKKNLMRFKSYTDKIKLIKNLWMKK